MGDVTIFYDLRMSTPGKQPYHIKNRLIAHQVLTPEGIPDAPTILNEKFDEIIRPLQTKAVVWVGDTTREMYEEMTQETESAQRPIDRDRNWRPQFM